MQTACVTAPDTYLLLGGWRRDLITHFAKLADRVLYVKSDIAC